jgi:hypothetical protein
VVGFFQEDGFVLLRFVVANSFEKARQMETDIFSVGIQGCRIFDPRRGKQVFQGNENEETFGEIFWRIAWAAAAIFTLVYEWRLNDGQINALEEISNIMNDIIFEYRREDEESHFSEMQITRDKLATSSSTFEDLCIGLAEEGAAGETEAMVRMWTGPTPEAMSVVGGTAGMTDARMMRTMRAGRTSEAMSVVYGTAVMTDARTTRAMRAGPPPEETFSLVVGTAVETETTMKATRAGPPPEILFLVVEGAAAETGTTTKATTWAGRLWRPRRRR